MTLVHFFDTLLSKSTTEKICDSFKGLLGEYKYEVIEKLVSIMYGGNIYYKP